MMETLSETEFAPSMMDTSFIPNSFVDISEFMNKKLKIMKTFKRELAEYSFPRSVKHIKVLVTLRGATCQYEYAESFILLKGIE